MGAGLSQYREFLPAQEAATLDGREMTREKREHGAAFIGRALNHLSGYVVYRDLR
jgi:hypothetical protein